MKGTVMLALAAALALGACAAAGGDEGEAGVPAPLPPPDSVPPPTTTYLPRGTELLVRLGDSLGSERTRVGDRFTVTVLDSLLTLQKQVVIPAGATITGLVTGVHDPAHDGAEAYLRLNFVRLTLGKANHPFAAEIVATTPQASDAAEDFADVASDTAAGGVGGVLAGDLRTAVESAGLGAGAGTIISLGTTGEEAILPAGTEFRIRTGAAIALER